MAERDDIEVEGGEKPKRAPKPKPAPKPAGAKGGGPAAVLPWVIALAALGLSGYLFVQLGAINKKLHSDTGPLPKGSPEAQAQAAAGEGEGEGETVLDWREDAEGVDYEVGKFTANTSDGRAAKMDLWVKIESYYVDMEWEAYQAQMKHYEEQLANYYKFQKGEVDANGNEIKTKKKKGGEEAAIPSGLVLAGFSAPQVIMASGGEAKPAEPPKMPEEPLRPLTVMEKELAKQQAMVKDIVIEQINIHTAAELISAEGREAFKQAIIDALSGAIDRHFGTIKDVYFSELVTT